MGDWSVLCEGDAVRVGRFGVWGAATAACCSHCPEATCHLHTHSPDCGHQRDPSARRAIRALRVHFLISVVIQFDSKSARF